MAEIQKKQLCGLAPLWQISKKKTQTTLN